MVRRAAAYVQGAIKICHLARDSDHHATAHAISQYPAPYKNMPAWATPLIKGVPQGQNRCGSHKRRL